MENETGLRGEIKRTLIHKSNIQQRVFDNTSIVFSDLKSILHEMSSDLNDELWEQLSEGVKIDYRDRGKFEAQFHIASDVLIFSMHTNVFEFNRDHSIWENNYTKEDPDNSYCGIINIYNCLADSLKYSRLTDEAYLIGRIFINHEMNFFVEGKRQERLSHTQFGRTKIDKAAIVDIVESAVYYALEFDLLVPPYDTVKVVLADQLSTKNEHSKMETGKRMGYEFKSDDI